MGILSKRDIKEYIKKKKIVFAPKVKDSQIGRSSVDLTLSDIFWVFKEKYLDRKNKEPVDLGKVSYKQALKKIKSKSIILESQAMCLGLTKEKIKISKEIVGKLGGRSRFARMGLAVHITSSIHHPGSNNRLVLEIVNMAPFPIKIHAGMEISQIAFHTVEN